MRRKFDKIARWIKTGGALFLLLMYFAFLIYACASPGRPSGGLYDENPPTFIGSNPKPNAINFTGNKIELNFDEYIALEKPEENIIITPPQMQNPVIKGVGRKVTVELKDSLRPNTTYTFDFTNSIVDNNEKNELEGFTFAFSTGDVVDSLTISGLLLNAENLEPMPGILIGLHKNPEDSAFTSIPFDRTSKTNETGRFWIRNITPGEYRLFALEDQNKNYRYDFPQEGIAFEDPPIIPSFISDIRRDTIRIDSLSIDTIHEIHYNRFIPDDVVMYFFTDQFVPQYFSRSERTSDRQFKLQFNSDAGFPPTVYLLDEPGTEEKNNTPWYIAEYAPNKKDIIYWITDSLIYKQDTIRVEMDYMAHDSLRNLVSYTDTLLLNLRRRSSSEPKKGEKEKIEFLNIELTPVGSIDIFDTIKIMFDEPLWDLDASKLKFTQKVDTVWEAHQFPILQDTLNPRLYYVQNAWNFGEEFGLAVDSAEIYSIYGKWNDSINFKWKFRSPDEYGDLYIKVVGNEHLGFGELLNASDKVVRTSPLYSNGELVFENLKPAKYYLRYIDDSNGNGKWDPGNYEEKRQPEKVYYFEGAFEIRKLLEIEHTWDIKALSRTEQKPLEITKNKPKEKRPKRNEQQNNQQDNQQNNQGRNDMGTPNTNRTTPQSLQRGASGLQPVEMR